MSSIATRTSSWRDRLDPVLLAALLLGLALRVVHLGHGLPYVYNPDESSILSRALSLASGDLNPHNFLYPSLYFYVLAGCVGGFAVISRIAGQVQSLAQFEAQFWQDPSAVYLIGRSLSVLAGVLTIVAVFRLALRLGDRARARVAAVLMAVAYVPVRDAHFLKHDVPATLLIVLSVLASWWVWKRGSSRDYVLAGASVGVACAFHYPAALTIVPLAVAHLLRSGVSVRRLFGAPAWAAALAATVVFSICSPYVLIDHSTALRDIQANRAIIVGRSQQTYGLFGSALPQLDILRTQGTGIAWLIAVVVGLFALARLSGTAFIWFAAFPVAFALLISNTWPFGRTANPLYPFLAVLGSAGLVWMSRRFGRAATPALVILTALAAAEPMMLSLRFDMLMGQTDTRTLALQWVEANVPQGSGVAVEPYSVQLRTTRDQLLSALNAAGVRPERAGRRVRTQLSRTSDVVPSYRVFYIGERGMDEDKIYIAPATFSLLGSGSAPGAPCLDYILLKRAAPRGTNPLSRVVSAYASEKHEVNPLSDPAAGGDGFLADFDVRPSWAVTRPGPAIEIWRTYAGCTEEGRSR